MARATHTTRLLAGAAAAAGVAWLATRYVHVLLEEQRCKLRPLTPDDWAALLSTAASRDEVATAVRRGGLDPRLRAAAWPVLLGVHDVETAQRARSYATLQRRCHALEASASDASATDDEAAAYGEARRVIAADVPRTPLDAGCNSEALTRVLRAFAVANVDVLYAQGMSEIAAVFCAVFRDDEPLFLAAFSAFINQQRRCFLADVKSGISARLRALGSLLKRADGAVGARLVLLGCDDCAWALCLLAVLLLRELGIRDAASLFDVLMVRSSTPRCSCRPFLRAGDS